MITVLNMDINNTIRQGYLINQENNKYMDNKKTDIIKSQEINSKFLILKNHIKICYDRWLCYISLLILDYLASHFKIFKFLRISQSLWTFFTTIFIVLIVGSENELNVINQILMKVLKYIKVIQI
jgi:hypothetical protein